MRTLAAISAFEATLFHFSTKAWIEAVQTAEVDAYSRQRTDSLMNDYQIPIKMQQTCWHGLWGCRARFVENDLTPALLCIRRLWLWFWVCSSLLARDVDASPGVEGNGLLLISEFQAWNTVTLLDQDQDTEDWIEIHNPGLDAVSLDGWSLTDNAALPQKWLFPNMSLAGGGHVIVFASGKNRRRAGRELHANFRLGREGGYLGLFARGSAKAASEFAPFYPPQVADVSYGISAGREQVIHADTNAPVRFFIPAAETPLPEGWQEREFDDFGWPAGVLALGYEAASAEFTKLVRTSLRTRMLNRASMVAVRVPFVVGNPSLLESLRMSVRFDDGFVAWINGQEAARSNAPEEWDFASVALSDRPRDLALTPEEFNLRRMEDWLIPGTNVLAILALNQGKTDPDFLLSLALDSSLPRGHSGLRTYFTNPTPGSPNASGLAVMGPILSRCGHFPAQPGSSDPLLVRVLVSPALSVVRDVKLTYRVMFQAEQTIPMWDDGRHDDGAASDHWYAAAIPGGLAAPGQMIRYFVVASDVDGRESRFPVHASAQQSPKYAGTVALNPEVQSALPVLEWFIERPTAANTSSGTRCSLFYGGRFYDNVGMNSHGQSSLSFPKLSYDVDLNAGHHFIWDPSMPPVDDFNLLTTYPDKSYARNILSYEVFRDAGAPYHFVLPVRVQQNGSFFSVAHLMENGDDNYLKRLGLDPEGALYKSYNTLSSTEPTEKKTRKFEGKGDLTELIAGARRTGTARTRYLFDHIDIPEVVNYLAAMIITGGNDCCHKNYYIYRDTLGSGLWSFLPWDQDLTFGRNWTGGYFDDRMYPQNGLNVGDNNIVLQALFSTPQIQAMYVRRVRTLMEELLQAPGTPAAELRMEARLAVLEKAIVPDAALDLAKWRSWGQRQTASEAIAILRTNYLPARRRHLFNTLAGGNNPAIPARQPRGLGLQLRRIDVSPESRNQDQEYVELFNTNRIAVDVSGWNLRGAITHTLLPGTVIPQNASLFVAARLAAFRARTNGPSSGQGLFVQGDYKGRLSARGGQVELLDSAGSVAGRIEFPESSTAWQRHLRITQIHYHPDAAPDLPEFEASDFEFVEIKNTGAETLLLAGSRLGGGIGFLFSHSRFPWIQAGEKVYVVRNERAFKARYGYALAVAGEFEGALANGGNRLELHDPTGEVVLDFAYDNRWYSEANGRGRSLVASREDADWTLWRVVTGWRASEEALRELPSDWLNRHFGANTSSAIRGAGQDPDGDGSANAAEFAAGTSPVDKGSVLRLEYRREPGGEGMITWDASPNRSYALEWSLSPVGPWNLVERLDATPQGRTIVLAAPSTTPVASYFRLRIPAEP